MTINDKDIVPLKLSEFRMDGVFYLKQEQGFDHCKIFSENWNNLTIWKQMEVKAWLKKMSSENRLFINRNNPYKPLTY